MKSKLFTLVVGLLLMPHLGLQAQSENRTPSKTSVSSMNSLPVEPRLQASLDVLSQSLKVNSGSKEDQIQKLLFTETEFEAIYEQTYNRKPGENDKKTFHQKQETVLNLLNGFRNPELQTQVLNVIERSGDNSLRAKVVTVKFTHQNLNKIAKFIMIKFNQAYKIMMLDE